MLSSIQTESRGFSLPIGLGACSRSPAGSILLARGRFGKVMIDGSSETRGKCDRGRPARLGSDDCTRLLANPRPGTLGVDFRTRGKDGGVVSGADIAKGKDKSKGGQPAAKGRAL